LKVFKANNKQRKPDVSPKMPTEHFATFDPHQATLTARVEPAKFPP
jgi:hypothetical protein